MPFKSALRIESSFREIIKLLDACQSNTKWCKSYLCSRRKLRNRERRITSQNKDSLILLKIDFQSFILV
jgi:hypothetical protein